MKRHKSSNECKSIESCTVFKFMKINFDIDFMKPSKRSGHRAVCNESDLYIWGGFCPTHETIRHESPLYPELWRYNFAKRTWYLLKTTGDVPAITVASHSVILYGNNLIVYGGTGFPFGERTGDSIYLCNLKTLEWKHVETTGDRLLGLYGSSLVQWNNYLYILFGTTAHEYCSNVYRVDLRTLESVKLFDSLKILADSPKPFIDMLEDNYPNGFLYGRYRQEVIVHANKIYTFGGSMRNGEAYSLDVLPVFDLITNTWGFVHTEPDMISNKYPDNRKFHTCLKVNTDVFIFGGVDHKAGYIEIKIENYAWKLDLNTMRWMKLEIRMPLVTYFHASCISPTGVAWFHGGVTTIGGRTQRINDLYRINLQIPKLADICWEILINSYDNLVNLDKKILYEIGIPSKYINMLA